jgi:hypothetical protein
MGIHHGWKAVGASEGTRVVWSRMSSSRRAYVALALMQGSSGALLWWHPLCVERISFSLATAWRWSGKRSHKRPGRCPQRGFWVQP